MAERTSSGLLTMMLEPTPAVAMTLPAEVREKLAELELELSEGRHSRVTGSYTCLDHRPSPRFLLGHKSSMHTLNFCNYFQRVLVLERDIQAAEMFDQESLPQQQLH
ncbi:hypothetical protein OJAV_G00205890 [Oryzias javanicus]|uniref:Uncharacterized protein n=1 Tax=Oryzias javanicus TaxID=123683 RepID=A0A437C670_ORYJA|nr:hypothetical protein OJAV_G00205890 [Oryzias javanicus]